jgi:hypothetical protein
VVYSHPIGTVDLNTLIAEINGVPILLPDSTLDIGQVTKFYYTLNLYEGGDFFISFETVDSPSTSYSLTQFFPEYSDFTISDVDVIINPACFDMNNGSIDFLVDNVEVLVSWSYLNADGATSSQAPSSSIEGLNAEVIIALIFSDAYCSNSLDSIILNLEIPDGSFTVDLDVTASYFSCTSDSLDTSGGIPAEVEGVINGGSGDFSHSLANATDLVWFSDSLVQVQGNLVPGNYLLQSVDSLTGCTSNTPFTVPDSVIVFELELVNIVPIATNGLGTFYLDDHGIITVEPNLSGYTVDYEWSPGPGNDSVPGTYSELQDPVVYTVMATVDGSDCTTSLQVDMTDFICLYSGDFNADGQIDGADLGQFLVVFGTSCPDEPGCLGDLNYDGIINTDDLTMFFANFGTILGDVCQP